MPKKNGTGKKKLNAAVLKISEQTKIGNVNPVKECKKPAAAEASINESSEVGNHFSSFEHVAETKSKVPEKRHKKKEKKQKLDLKKLKAENMKSVEDISLSELEWQSTGDLQSCEEAVARVEENVLTISKVELLECTEKKSPSPAMDEDEKKSLHELLKTLDIVDTQIREQKPKPLEKKSESDYEVIEFSKRIKTAESIAEEIFEEMVENEALKQKNEVDLFRKPSLRPEAQGGEQGKMEPNAESKILYSYNGVPLNDDNKKESSQMLDGSDGLLLINNIRYKEQDRFPFRQLDVIMEEGSDISDTSSAHSDKKTETNLLYKIILDRRERVFDGRGNTLDFQIQPVIKETVKIIPMYENVKDNLKADSTRVRIETVFVEKINPTSIVKIELPDSESEVQDERIEVVHFEDKNDFNTEEITDKANDTSLFSKHSLNLSNIKFIDEDSEKSWSSSGINNTDDDIEADVESELDNRRETFMFENDISAALDDILELENEPDYSTIKRSPLKSKDKIRNLDESPEKKQIINEATQEKVNYQTNHVNLKNSQTFSGENSATSILSGETVKYRLHDTSEEDVNLIGKARDKCFTGDGKDSQEIINLGNISNGVSAMKNAMENKFKDDKMIERIMDVRREGSVRKLAKELEEDINKILISKMKVIEFFEEPIMSETSWSSILEDTKLKMNGRIKIDEEKDKFTSDDRSNFSIVKFKHHSNSSSYENIYKSLESLLENENIYEVIQSPEALSHLAEKKVMSLPYGRFLLRKIGLGKCCKDEQEDEKNLDDDTYTKIDRKVGEDSVRSQHTADLARTHSDSSYAKSWCLPCGRGRNVKNPPETTHPSYIEFNWSNPYGGHALEKWYGTPTSHPAVLLGLSPSQKKVYEEKRKKFLSSKEEAANLLDLHKKFLERRSYHERDPLKKERTLVFDSKEAIYSEFVPREQIRQNGDASIVNGTRETTAEKSAAREEENSKIREDEEEKSKCIGSCGLLAVLQKARSNDLVPELNNKAGYGPSLGQSENTREKQPVWQRENKFGFVSKNDSGTENVSELWDRRRPESVKVGSEFIEEWKSAKGPENTKKGEENCVVTAKLSSVSDVVKTFEKPVSERVTSWNAGSGNGGRPRVPLKNEKHDVSNRGDVVMPQNGRKPGLSEEEVFKQRMYDECLSKVVERIERRQQNVIKISTSRHEIEEPEEGKYPDIKNEFIMKARERMIKLGMKDDLIDLGERRKGNAAAVGLRDSEGTVTEEKITNSRRFGTQLLLGATSDLSGLPKHLRELLQAENEFSADDFEDLQGKLKERKLKTKTYLSRSKQDKYCLLKDIDDGLVLSKGFLFGRGLAMFSPTFKATAPRPGIWSPVQTATEEKTEVKAENEERKKLEDEPIPHVWTPKSAQASPILERKEFRPVNFESPTLPRKKYIQEERSESVPPPWQQSGGEKSIEVVRKPISPALSLPKAPNPTVTLLQKAREGQLPRGAHYLYHNMSNSLSYENSITDMHERANSSKDDLERPKKIELGQKKITGIGPITKEGIPLVLRSEVTEENKEKWYKRMYDSLHKAGKDEDFVTVKYRTSPSRKGLYGYQPVSSTGYQSEPETIIYDSNRFNKYTTLDRRRSDKSKENDFISITLPRSRASTPRYGSEPYRNQPGRIEDYEPGHSSISELEARQWWDEVLEIFDRWLERNPDGHGPDSSKLLTDAIHRRRQEEGGQPIYKVQSPKSFMTYALKDSGFISDPQHVFKRRDDDFQSQLSPQEQKEAYRVIQKGGEVPLRGLRKPAPERPKDDQNPQIEYFPLSPTLTRIRVHKQNITPLSQFPFIQFPIAYQQSALSFPNLPFGVCNSFSQVQFFPTSFTNHSFESKIIPDVANASCSDQLEKNSKIENRKFSVHLQTISDPNDFVRIVPKPRTHSKKTPIYANLPVREAPIKEEENLLSLSSEASSLVEHTSGKAKSNAEKTLPGSGGTDDISAEQTKSDLTFSDLKRIAPSIASKTFSKIKTKGVTEKESFALVSSSSVKGKKTDLDLTERSRIRSPDKSGGKLLKQTKIPIAKKEKKISGVSTSAKKAAKKVPLSESLQRENPLSSKRSKSGSTKKGTKKAATHRCSEYSEPTIGFSSDKIHREIETETRNSETDNMSPAYEPANQDFRYKHKVESNVTEAFRSRSFSPDVRRKVPKPPEKIVPPMPPKRKLSKNSPTLRMWSKMMVTYPNHRSRLDLYDSNVKFLREKLRRKLDHDVEDKENESQFGEDIETFRTVKKDKDGNMSIRTNRYVNIARPISTSPISPLRYTYNEHGRRVLSEPRAPTSASRSAKQGEGSTCIKANVTEPKKTTAKQKGDTLVRSSTTYSVRRPINHEDKRKSVKVTVAVSSKGKEFLRKSASLTSPTKKSMSTSPLSPCPSVSSYRSMQSGTEKCSTSSLSPQNRFFSPNSSTGRISSPSRSGSPASVVSSARQKVASPPLTLTFVGDKTKKLSPRKPKEATIKSSGGRIVSQIPKITVTKTDAKRKIKKSDKAESDRKHKKNGNGRIAFKKKMAESSKNEVAEHVNLVRTDSFFQNLFLRNAQERKPMVKLDRTSSVLERARKYQKIVELPAEPKPEPSLSLVTYYLSQKRPVSQSKFKYLDRELSCSRSPSPYLSRSPSVQIKLRHFDSLSQLGDEDFEQLTPNTKERSSSEPPIGRLQLDSPVERMGIKPASRLSASETSSLRTSPISSRSPSCRRILSFRPATNAPDCRRRVPRARSAGEVEEMKPKSTATPSLVRSTSSLNLSNLSDHTEYQAYVLELMHSKEKCQRFRDLHKFYSSLERLGELERTASIGDLRPRLKNEEIIDFDRWKQLRTKERAEAELKTLVGKLIKVQKEKDLVFRTADVDALRWKGDRGLRIKERSVEDLKEHFSRTAENARNVDSVKKCMEIGKDVYKPFWRGNSIVNLASNFDATNSYRGRPVTVEELQRIKAAEERLAKKFGLKSFSSRAWSSLSTEQVKALKNQLSEIYSQELKKKGLDVSDLENYEITVPEDSSIKTPGEKGLYVRCNSALTKDQIYSVKKEEAREGKKSGSISALPSWKSDAEEAKGLLELPWKEDLEKGRATSSRPLTESEKKRLSMTLSKEVLEKLTKAPVKTHLLPRETLGALVIASNALRSSTEPSQEVFSPRTCYSLETSEDDKSKNDFLLVLTPTEKGKDVEKVVEEWANGTLDNVRPTRTTSITELESASASSETSVKTVIRNPVDVLKKVEYYEELQQSAEESMATDATSRRDEIGIDSGKSRSSDRYRSGPLRSHSLENLGELFGEHRIYSAANNGKNVREEERIRSEDFHTLRKVFEEEKQPFYRYSPTGYRSSNESIFSIRSRSISPDPTKYYRAYLRMVKCGAVRKLRNKFESWEDLLALSTEKNRWLPPKRYASDPELTRDLLRRYGTDPTKVTIRGQEVGDVRWLRTKYEREAEKSRSRFRSPIPRNPFTASDRLMPRINVISKTAELQMTRRRSPDGTSSRQLPASPDPHRSLSEYARDHCGYLYTGEVDKLRRKFENLHAAERLSILGQMYTSTPDVNELRDVAPYLGCSWVAHRHPELSKTSSSPELRYRRPEATKKVHVKPRPHSSSPVRPKQPSSILKPASQRDIFADQKYDPSIHRPVYRYQPEVDEHSKRRTSDYPHWRQWNKPSVKFKEPVGFARDSKSRDSTPDSPRKYVESEVTIHYKSPVRSEAKALLSEDELARRQAESMKRIYKEERRRKYLQELQDMNSRRHADNFIPSQKSPIPLNRYDDFPDEASVHPAKGRDQSAEPVLVARGLYDFVGRRPRELAFHRGDIIFIIRQLDKNWCEGELNGAVGLFPLSYVEIIPYSEYNPKFGRARAKYDFVPQTSLELLAHKGEMITLVRKIDENWFEGRIGDRTGIIPASYCQVLSMPQVRTPNRPERPAPAKPVAAPAAHSLIHNGNATPSKHYYTPFYGGRNSPGRSATPAVREAHAAIDQLIDEALYHLEEDLDSKRPLSKSATQPLNLRVNPRPEPALYQVLFNHVPNNDDELELIQGETVLVLDKCGDGWFIGSKTNGGKLGIFPGTHVRRIAPEFV